MFGKNQRPRNLQEVFVKGHHRHSNSSRNWQHHPSAVRPLSSDWVPEVAGNLAGQFSNPKLLDLRKHRTVLRVGGHISEALEWWWGAVGGVSGPLIGDEWGGKADDDPVGFRVVVVGRGDVWALVLQEEDAAARKASLLRQPFLYWINHRQERTYRTDPPGFH